MSGEQTVVWSTPPSVMAVDRPDRVVVTRDVPSAIVVAAPSAVAVVRPDAERVVVATSGPKGDRGDTGPMRPPDAREFVFASADDVWVVEHEMGFAPAVGIYDSLGVQKTGVVVENNATRTVVQFYYPTAGRLTLS